MNRSSRWASALLWMALTPLVGDAKNAPPSYWVCVSNERSGTMTVIDGDSWRVSATIPLGKRPRGIHAAADGRTVYVTLSGSPIAEPTSEAKNEPPMPAPDRQPGRMGAVEV